MRREVGEEWLGSVRRGVRDRLGSSPGETMEQSQAQEVTYATIRRPSAQNVRSAVEAAHLIGGDRHRRFAGATHVEIQIAAIGMYVVSVVAGSLMTWCADVP